MAAFTQEADEMRLALATVVGSAILSGLAGAALAQAPAAAPAPPPMRLTSTAFADGTPILSDSFETPVEGLYAVGPAAIESFGPLMRFMVGAEFAAPRVASRLARVFGASTERRAA